MIAVDLTPLFELQKRLRTKIIKQAVREVGRPIRDKIRAASPVLSGALAKSIWVKITSKRGKTTAIIGPRSQYTAERNGQTVKPSKYAALVERGTRNTAIAAYARKSGKMVSAYTRKPIEGKHFIEQYFRPTQWFADIVDAIRAKIN